MEVQSIFNIIEVCIYGLKVKLIGNPVEAGNRK